MSGLLNDTDLVKAVIRLKEFRPAEGASGRILISGEPGGSRVSYVLAATEDVGLVFEISSPPSDEALCHLYRESERIVEAAWDQPAVSGASVEPGGRPSVTLGGVTFDVKGLGFDS